MSVLSIAFAASLAWFIAQVIKTIRVSLQKKRFAWHMFFHAGEMPSSHSAITVALATGIYKTEGFTAVFLVALAFSLITMYDAMTARRQIGMQAHILNMLKGVKRLEELTGHTPFQVLIGALLGYGTAMLLVP